MYGKGLCRCTCGQYPPVEGGGVRGGFPVGVATGNPVWSAWGAVPTGDSRGDMAGGLPRGILESVGRRCPAGNKAGQK